MTRRTFLHAHRTAGEGREHVFPRAHLSLLFVGPLPPPPSSIIRPRSERARNSWREAGSRAPPARWSIFPARYNRHCSLPRTCVPCWPLREALLHHHRTRSTHRTQGQTQPPPINQNRGRLPDFFSNYDRRSTSPHDDDDDCLSIAPFSSRVCRVSNVRRASHTEPAERN